MHKQMIRVSALLLALTFCLLCGCSIGSGKRAETLPAWADSLEPDVRAALAEGKKGLLWKVGEPELQGTAAHYRYSPLDCRELWEPFLDACLPDAKISSDEEDGGTRIIKLQYDGRELEAALSANLLSVAGLDVAEAQTCAGKLVPILEKTSGFPMWDRGRNVQTDSVTDYESILEGFSVDPSLSLNCIRVQADGTLWMQDPVCFETRTDEVELAGKLSADDLQMTAELSYPGGCDFVPVLERCELVYTDDEGVLVPAWYLTGTAYPLNGGQPRPTEVLIDAETGVARRCLS